MSPANSEAIHRNRSNRDAVLYTDMYEVPDAVPPIHAESSYIATDKDPSKFQSIFSDNLQPIATRGKIARDTLLVDIGCSSERAPPPLVITTKLAAAIYGGAANNIFYSVLPLWYHTTEASTEVEVQSVTNFTRDRKPSKQCIKSAAKARSVPGLIQRHFRKLDKNGHRRFSRDL